VKEKTAPPRDTNTWAGKGSSGRLGGEEEEEENGRNYANFNSRTEPRGSALQ
jgi:hypothetical protein